MNNSFSTKAERAIEEGFALTQEAWRILDLIVAEFKSDPMSVQCFDDRIVERAINLVDRRKALDKIAPFPSLD